MNPILANAGVPMLYFHLPAMVHRVGAGRRRRVVRCESAVWDRKDRGVDRHRGGETAFPTPLGFPMLLLLGVAALIFGGEPLDDLIPRGDSAVRSVFDFSVGVIWLGPSVSGIRVMQAGLGMLLPALLVSVFSELWLLRSIWRSAPPATISRFSWWARLASYPILVATWLWYVSWTWVIQSFWTSMKSLIVFALLATATIAKEPREVAEAALVAWVNADAPQLNALAHPELKARARQARVVQFFVDSDEKRKARLAAAGDDEAIAMLCDALRAVVPERKSPFEHFDRYVATRREGDLAFVEFESGWINTQSGARHQFPNTIVLKRSKGDWRFLWSPAVQVHVDLDWDPLAH